MHVLKNIKKNMYWVRKRIFKIFIDQNYHYF